MKDLKKKIGDDKELRKLGYPNEKINEHVYQIQIRKGLKKKDPFFDKLMKDQGKKDLLDLTQND